MRDKNSLSLVDKRREHNQDLLRRMRSGESLRTVDSRASWFPPRPIIEKDQEAISKLYDSKPSATPEGADLSADLKTEPKVGPTRRGRFDQVG